MAIAKICLSVGGNLEENELMGEEEKGRQAYATRVFSYGLIRICNSDKAQYSHRTGRHTVMAAGG